MSHNLHCNHLAHEKSPYLLQHKDNPVWWHSWQKKAFERAATENKPIFLSIGYSTCHWCHVMESDSFEKADVAKILNEYFVAIKVDREERPDVDSIYMSALLAINNQGGWPMSIFMTPDGKPFFAATFIPRRQFKQLLLEIARMWNSSEYVDFIGTADKITAHLQQMANTKSDEKGNLTIEPLKQFYFDQLAKFDEIFGGFGVAPKFPPYLALMTLLRIYHRTREHKALDMVTVTIDNILKGGIFDQLGGGLHRYGTDQKWLIPHFEKMLYDNALFVLALGEAYQVTRERDYEYAIKRTLHFVLTSMEQPQGGFYAALDADSEKSEGRFYVWQWDELQAVLDDKEFWYLTDIFTISPKGNFSTHAFSSIEKSAGFKGIENANILAIKNPWTISDLEENIQFIKIREKLLNWRNRRKNPLLDDQIITGWNGLMIAAFASAYSLFGDSHYLKSAQKAANFIKSNLFRHGILLRRYVKGDARFNGQLEDYASLIFGLIKLYQVDFDQKWLEWAIELQDKQNELFWNNRASSYFETDGSDLTLIIRQTEFVDNVLPCGNSLSVLNLSQLAHLLLKEDYMIKANRLIEICLGQMRSYPSAQPMLLQALDYLTDSKKFFAVVAFEDLSKRDLITFSRVYAPNKILAFKKKNQEAGPVALLQDKLALDANKPTYYVCNENACTMQTIELDTVLGELEKFIPYKI